MRILHGSRSARVPRSPVGSVRLLRCEVGGRAFCLEMAHVATVQREAESSFRPNPERSGPLGYLERDGLRTPVHTLAELLREPGAVESPLAAVVTVQADPPWAFAVERATESRVGLDRLFDLPRPLAAALAGRVRGVALYDEGPAYLLDAPGLLGGDLGASAPLQDSEAALAFYAGASDQRRVFRFREPGRNEGPSLAVSTVQTMAALYPPPLAPAPGPAGKSLGVIAFQGAPAPVLDLGSLLGGSPTVYDRAERVLLVRGAVGRQLCALPTGASLRRLELSGSSRRLDDPPGVAGVLGAFQHGDEELWPLDIDAALA
ncbi:MAG: hypothetical protein GC160_29280 [Acidobacteria bacterium]|nr:hypothetical protein [Acidobacteriota bacterium]